MYILYTCTQILKHLYHTHAYRKKSITIFNPGAFFSYFFSLLAFCFSVWRSLSQRSYFLFCVQVTSANTPKNNSKIKMICNILAMGYSSIFFPLLYFLLLSSFRRSTGRTFAWCGGCENEKMHISSELCVCLRLLFVRFFLHLQRFRFCFDTCPNNSTDANI